MEIIMYKYLKIALKHSGYLNKYAQLLFITDVRYKILNKVFFQEINYFCPISNALLHLPGDWRPNWLQGNPKIVKLRSPNISISAFSRWYWGKKGQKIKKWLYILCAKR